MILSAAIRILLLAFLAIALTSTDAHTQGATPASTRGPKQYVGTFAPELIENPTLGTALPSSGALTLAKPEQLRRLPIVPGPEAMVYFGSKHFDVREGGKMVVKKSIPLAVVSFGDSVILYANMSGDTIFKAEHRHVFQPMKDGGLRILPGDKDVWLQMPLPPGSIVKFFPIHFIWSPARVRDMANRGMGIKGVGALTPNSGLLWEGGQYLQGEANIDGTKVLLQYSVDPLTGKVNDVGSYGVDANGDGKIDVRSKAEWATRKQAGDPIVFKLGEDIYFSPLSVDNAKRQFTLVERTAADYTVVVLAVGNEIPDFAFVDIDGAKRKFSEFKGKYVLLDFWSLGCSPCLAEFPHLRTAYEKYKGRGFEILGIGQDSNLDAVRKFLVSRNATWAQTNTAIPEVGAQLQDFISNTLRINSLPTTVLVDPTGKIISTNRNGEFRLRGEELIQTLDKLLPLTVD